ncbi:phage tail protein [Paenibacillus polymyxa]|uniref:phage tail protein n=1 Tax=Paenibacillus polymyxa TaxID=1406 RepID=UPI002AB585DE|nr:phage tail protein [Paenibacillus polymyxa]MDY8022854.1 phage tail protein [Paenibacillus polymyxa]
MAIKEPRKFVTTDQGHADVLNIPITTLYENDQELAAQIENIKNDPAGNDIASKEALDNHVANGDLHVTASKQAAWSAAEGNAKQYTRDYAALKAHTHPASDLPSASTQARGIVQLNTSTGSTATDQAATPSAVKAIGDELRQLINNIKEAGSVKNVQRLTISSPGDNNYGTVDVAISAVNTAKTILNFTTTGGDDNNNVELIDATTIRVGRRSQVKLEVVEFN